LSNNSTNFSKSNNIDSLITRLREGDRRSAARLMTILEQDGEEIPEIIRKIYPYTGKANILGITGSPGVGKSSLINCIVEQYLAQNLKVGVIMVDPSSPFSGGALLGDRIRLKHQFSEERLFIRSMATRSHLGGLAVATRDIAKILDVWGADLIIIETVGVGQSEIEIYTAANTVVVILSPETGDDIQAIKAGILEITDIFVVNKMDLPGADLQVVDLQNMLNMGEWARDPHWRPPIVKTNAKTGENVPVLIKTIDSHRQYLLQQDALSNRVKERFKTEILGIIKHQFLSKIESHLNDLDQTHQLVEFIKSNRDPYSCAKEFS
jgi:LAO/AO transport system kinase